MPMPRIFFKAELETSNFNFEAYGYDEKGARKALMDALHTHTYQYQLDKNWWEKYVDDAGIPVKPVMLNQAYRDGEMVVMDGKVRK